MRPLKTINTQACRAESRLSRGVARPLYCDDTRATELLLLRDGTIYKKVYIFLNKNSMHDDITIQVHVRSTRPPWPSTLLRPCIQCLRQCAIDVDDGERVSLILEDAVRRQ